MSEPGEPSRPDDRARPLRQLGFLVHPLLLAAYPVLYLFARNIQEQVTISALVEPLVFVLTLTVVVLILALAVFRDAVRAGLATSLLAAIVFGFGHVQSALSDVLTSPGQLLAISALLLCGGVLVIWRIRGRIARAAARVLNVAAAALLIFNIVPIAEYQLSALGRAQAPAAVGLQGRGPSTSGQQRDVYWIILDRYGSGGVLSEFYDFDNSAFLDALRERGFYVAAESRANYLKSALTISSTLKMDYHDPESLSEQAASPDDFGPLYRMLGDALPVQSFLKSQGYRYIHMGNWWQGTARNAAADLNLRYGELSEFANVLYESTILPALAQVTGADGGSAQDLPFRERHRRQTLYHFERLPLVAQIRGPKFVLAHIVLPHSPYVFDRDGGVVTEAMERSRSREVNYTEQVQYANKRTLELIDVLLAGPPETDPIIVLQGDEGPYPVRYSGREREFRWAEATVDELTEKFGIFNSYYLPGVDPEEGGLYPSITPVNSFRVVFNTYFGTDLPILPARQIIFQDAAHLYELTDATPRLEAGE